MRVQLCLLTLSHSLSHCCGYAMLCELLMLCVRVVLACECVCAFVFARVRRECVCVCVHTQFMIVFTFSTFDIMTCSCSRRWVLSGRTAWATCSRYLLPVTGQLKKPDVLASPFLPYISHRQTRALVTTRNAKQINPRQGGRGRGRAGGGRAGRGTSLHTRTSMFLAPARGTSSVAEGKSGADTQAPHTPHAFITHAASQDRQYLRTHGRQSEEGRARRQRRGWCAASS
jgi:hypothetical protein